MCMPDIGTPHAQLILLNLTLDDPETVLNTARAITSNATINEGDFGCTFEKVTEIKQGVCILQVQHFGLNKTLNTNVEGNVDSRNTFIFELLTWKSETLPKALKAWSTIILDHGHEHATRQISAT